MKPVFKELFLGKKQLTLKGNIVFPDGVRWSTISFTKGKGIITQVGDGDRRKSSEADKPEEVDLILEDGLLFPGFIDLHVHAREDSSQEWTHKETYISAAKAALAGGVTAFADMPNTPAPAVDDTSYSKKSRLSRYSGMEVLPYAGIGPETKPLDLKVPYKVFMGKSIGPLYFTEKADLKRALKRYEGKNVSFHCEDPGVLKANESKEHHRQRRPPEAEVGAVELAVELIEEFELEGKICHISTRDGLELIQRKKKNSRLPITVEVSPHHLLFEDNGNGIEFPACLKRSEGGEGTEGQQLPEGFFQVNPPIREHRDRMALLKAFREGMIDYLATDHAPHTREEKMNGISGIPYLDSYGNIIGCLLELGVPPDIVAACAAYAPGKFVNEFGLSGRQLKTGEIANLCYLEKGEEEVVRGGVFTKAGWNPFEGYVFPWNVGFTIIRGRGWKKTLPRQTGESQIGRH